MDEGATSAITAIADARVESSIAASLHRLGWTVLYRATSLDGLLRAISAHPQALILSSSDFRGFNTEVSSRHIQLQAPVQPMSDISLLEIIRNREEPKVANARTLRLSQAKLFFVASNGRTAGATTIALNLARELSLNTSSTLLLDCNPGNPYLSRYLGINGLNREISRTSLGFSAGEIVKRSSLLELAPLLDSYEQIVIDYGQLQDPARTVSGRRVHEEIFSWAIHSQSQVLLVSRDNPRALEDLSQIISEFADVFAETRVELLLTLSKVLSGRERTRLISQLSTEMGLKPKLISRDHRSIAEMEAKGSTLADVAPKSLVLGEIRELMEVLR
ncbi:BY-kinase domain containing protein [Candidatus Nanopelagicaceae bacterium]